MNGSRATSARHNVATVGLAVLLLIGLDPARVGAAAKQEPPPMPDLPDEDLLEFLGEWTVDKGPWQDPLKAETWNSHTPSPSDASSSRPKTPSSGAQPHTGAPESSAMTPTVPDARNRSARP